LIGSKTKTLLRFVVIAAMNPMLRWSDGPASEQLSVIVPRERSRITDAVRHAERGHSRIDATQVYTDESTF
jgi:hypothetical protein